MAPPHCEDSFMDECVAVAVAVAEAVAVAVTEAVAEADQSIHDQSIHDPSIRVGGGEENCQNPYAATATAQGLARPFPLPPAPRSNIFCSGELLTLTTKSVGMTET